MSEQSEEQRRVVPRAAVNDAEFEGRVVDPTPRDNYTLAGRAANIPTPETDEETALLARHRLAKREWWAGAGQG